MAKGRKEGREKASWSKPQRLRSFLNAGILAVQQNHNHPSRSNHSWRSVSTASQQGWKIFLDELSFDKYLFSTSLFNT